MPLRIAHIGARERAALRRQEALDLRVQGKSYRKIGEALGVSGKTAFGDIQRSLADLARLERGKAEDARRLDLLRIDKGIAGLSAAYEAGDPKAVTAMVKLLERRAKLLGLDAPQRTLHGGDPEAPPVAVQVETMTEEQRLDRLHQLIELAQSRARQQHALPYHPPDGRHEHDGAGARADA
jgi:hypothetical protein